MTNLDFALFLAPHQSGRRPPAGPLLVSRSPLVERGFVQIICAFVAVFAVAALDANAQTKRSQTGFVSEDFELSSVDENGVDIISGSVRIASDLISIGSGDEPLTYTVITPSLAQTGASDSAQMLAVGLPPNSGGSAPFRFDNYSGGVSISGINDCNNWFEIGGSRTDFCGTLAAGLIASDRTNAKLELVSGLYVFTSTNGTKYYSSGLGTSSRQSTTATGLNKIVYPGGYVVDIQRGGGRVAITDNRGMQIRITDANTATATIVGFNMAVDYCAPLATSCSFSRSWPTATVFTGSATQPAVATDVGGRQTKLYPRLRSNGFSGHQFYQVKAAGSEESARTTYSFCGPWYDTSCSAIQDCFPAAGSEIACKIFQMSVNKVRTAEKEGKIWTYMFDYEQN